MSNLPQARRSGPGVDAISLVTTPLGELNISNFRSSRGTAMGATFGLAMRRPTAHAAARRGTVVSPTRYNEPFLLRVARKLQKGNAR